MADELRMLRAALNGWMGATVRRDGVSRTRVMSEFCYQQPTLSVSG
jgi:hypothetical protein